MTETKAHIAREALLDLCERGFVPEGKWWNRDSSAAQRQLGECYALLRAGCDFTVRTEGETHWVRVTFPGFDAFEYGDDKYKDDETFYLPTVERLARSIDRDWY